MQFANGIYLTQVASAFKCLLKVQELSNFSFEKTGLQ